MVSHTTFAHDLVISAVAYDTLLLHDISARLAIRLHHTPIWGGQAPDLDGPSTELFREDVSRVVLVLSQRLWGNDDATSAESAILRGRAFRNPQSVIVVSLDDDALPEWMASLPRCDLSTAGVDGVVSFVLDSITNVGGSVRAEVKPMLGDAAPQATRWLDAPIPFLGQSRAHGALRRELDALATELEPRVDAVDAREGDHLCELHKLPNRVIARLDDVGVSFSWVPGRAGTIAEGRLMVIEWSGVAAARGVAALRTARPVRERVYSAEANGASDWCWRADGPNGRASSTANLVGEWMDGAMMSAHALAAGGST